MALEANNFYKLKILANDKLLIYICKILKIEGGFVTFVDITSETHNYNTNSILHHSDPFSEEEIKQMIPKEVQEWSLK